MKRISIGRTLVMLMFCFLQTTVFAQLREISGTVKDAAGSPLPGVSIIVKGTVSGTVTDIDGKYTLGLSAENAVLVYSFIGFINQEVAVGEQSVIDVVLDEDVMQLDEIVVTGYGVSKKSDLTGSLASVKEEDFNKGAVVSPEQLIQGRVAGVQIVSNNGEPGAGSAVRIRGVSTVRGGTQPLYVVDGIPLDMVATSPGGPSGTSGGGAPATSPISFINPNDIESIDILKDASSAAIYGSRGANGVVFITTKKGKEGKSVVDYNYKFSIANLPKKLEVLSTEEWLTWRIDSLNKPEYNLGASTDWQDEVFRTAYSQDHNLSLSGGNQNATYRTSFNYLDQQGIIEKSDLKRYSGRLSISQKALNNRLVIDANLTATQNVENRVPVGTTGFEGDVLLLALKTNPTWPVYDSLGNPYQSESVAERSAVAMLEYTDDNTRTTRILGGISANFEITKGLYFKTNLGLDYANANRQINQSQKLNFLAGVGGVGQINNRELYNYLIENTLNYSKTLNFLSINALLGYSYQDFSIHGSNVTAGGYETDGIFYTNAIGTGKPIYTEINSYADAYKMQSMFGRLNLNFYEKYLFTSNFRADGSSKFGENNRYGYFPSFAGAWRLSQESFIQDLDFFSNLKLRLGWGQTGNSEILTKQSALLYGANNTIKAILDDEVILGYAPYQTDNPDLTWETTTSTNLGLDYGFFNGRLSGTVDLYNKVTTDLLLLIPTGPGSPSDYVWNNIDSCYITNKGIEFSLQGIILEGKDFGWATNANLSFLKNVVEGLPVELYKTGAAQGQGLTGAYCQIITNGQPMNVFYGLKVDSISPAGKVVYLKQKGSNKDSLTYLGNPQPKFTWSLSNTFHYKHFDLSIFVEGVHGNKIFNNTALLLDKPNLNQANNALKAFVEDEVSFTYTPVVSDRYIEDGSYVRISNIALGYNFAFKKTDWIKGLRFYGSVSNALLFTKYTGYDPDVSSSKDINGINSFGIDITNYPKARTFVFGVNASF